MGSSIGGNPLLGIVNIAHSRIFMKKLARPLVHQEIDPGSGIGSLQHIEQRGCQHDITNEPDIHNED
jgi:hypothetical protein